MHKRLNQIRKTTKLTEVYIWNFCDPPICSVFHTTLGLDLNLVGDIELVSDIIMKKVPSLQADIQTLDF